MPTRRRGAPPHRVAGLGAAACICSALLFAACVDTNVTTLSAPPTTDTTLTLTLQHSPSGDILATGSGATLYDFAPDSSHQSKCLNDGCVFQWPPLIVNGPVRVGPGVHQDLVATLRRPDGSTQLSYGGHPLYTYNMDVTPGMIMGQDIDQDGGLWYVLTAAGTEVHTSFSVTK